MSAITSFSFNGQQINTAWWNAPDGTRYLLSDLSDEQLLSLGVAKTVETIVTPPPPLSAIKTLRIAEINAECRARILAVWPLEKQISATLGIYGPAELAAMTDFIDAHIAASNIATSAVFDAATQAAMEAVTVAWPG